MSSADRDKWDARHGRGGPPGPAPAWLDRIVGHLPPWGNALDVASGSGRLAMWLAGRGYDTLAADVSPVGLARAQTEAQQRGLGLQTQVLDLEQEPFPTGPFSVVSCFHYLDRSLFGAMVDSLAPDGALVCEFHTTANLAFRAHPSGRFLLFPGELPALVAPLLVVQYGEGIYGDHAMARCVALKQ